MLKYDWQFNVLGIYNYRKIGKLNDFFLFIKNKWKEVEGDIVEAGCFQGRSLLATAMLLKELGSDKLVYGFDTFQGFPPVYHQNDNFSAFQRLYDEKRIEDIHWEQILLLRAYKSKLLSTNVDSPQNISTSGDFSKTSLDLLHKKIHYLGLDNIRIVQGSFEDTMLPSTQSPPKIMASLVDCDLYNSYKVCLPYLWSRTSTGGYMFLDEYYSLKFPGARIATDEFFADLQSKPFRHPAQAGDFERWGVIKK